MDYYQPTITATPEEFSETTGYKVGPYKLESTGPAETVLLFDFPKNTKIEIDGTILPGELFDYFNPLVLDPRIYSLIEFFPAAPLTCLRYSSSLFDLTKRTFYYPPKFSIDYKNVKVSRNPLPALAQISDICVVPPLILQGGGRLPEPAQIPRMRGPPNMHPSQILHMIEHLIAGDTLEEEYDSEEEEVNEENFSDEESD